MTPDEHLARAELCLDTASALELDPMAPPEAHIAALSLLAQAHAIQAGELYAQREHDAAPQDMHMCAPPTALADTDDTGHWQCPCTAVWYLHRVTPNHLVWTQQRTRPRTDT